MTKRGSRLSTARGRPKPYAQRRRVARVRFAGRTSTSDALSTTHSVPDPRERGSPWKCAAPRTTGNARPRASSENELRHRGVVARARRVLLHDVRRRPRQVARADRRAPPPSSSRSGRRRRAQAQRDGGNEREQDVDAMVALLLRHVQRHGARGRREGARGDRGGQEAERARDAEIAARAARAKNSVGHDPRAEVSASTSGAARAPRLASTGASVHDCGPRGLAAAWLFVCVAAARLRERRRTKRVKAIEGAASERAPGQDRVPDLRPWRDNPEKCDYTVARLRYVVQSVCEPREVQDDARSPCCLVTKRSEDHRRCALQHRP